MPNLLTFPSVGVKMPIKLTPTKKGVGKLANIGKLRKAANLTQAQLAERLGIKRSALAMWETGCNNPPTKYLLALAKNLNCPVEALLKDEEA